MEELKLFQSSEFGKIRVLELNSQPYFVGRDVAIALGYQRPYDAISQHVDNEDTVKCRIPDNQGVIQETTLINESGVYSLVFGSKLPTAKAFKRWVTSEVLPSIRKTGGYLATKSEDTPEEIMARALMVAQSTLAKREEKLKLLEVQTQQQQKQLEQQAPKVLFASAVETSQKSILIGELAKVLRQNGIEIGQNRLFSWLRQNGYLCSKGEYYNLPTQRSMDMALFELKKISITKPDGSVLVSTTPKITGKGQIYFVNKFLTSKTLCHV